MIRKKSLMFLRWSEIGKSKTLQRLPLKTSFQRKIKFTDKLKRNEFVIKAGSYKIKI